MTVRTPERYDIALGFDAKYVPHAAALIASVIANAPGAAFRFLVLHGGIAQERLDALQSAFPDAAFVWLEVTEGDMPKYVARDDLHYISAATLFRLGLEKLAPADCRRLLYLDCDLIVARDVRELWTLDLGELAGVPDPDVLGSDFATECNLPPSSLGYFNAGVLFIDLDQVRAGKRFTAAIDFVATNNPVLSDQDGLNWAMWGRWLRLDSAWNFQPRMLREAAAAGDPLPAKSIVHYSGANKPWLPGTYHPWAWLYWKYLALTPYFDEVVKTYQVGRGWRLRLWLRWQLRRPRFASVDHGRG